MGDVPSTVVWRCRRRCIGRIAATIFVISAQPHVEPVRWWRSPRIASALHITPEQQTAIDALYERASPERCRASLEVMTTTNNIVAALEAGRYDDDLLRLTEHLFEARTVQNRLRRKMLAEAASTLRPGQHVELSQWIARRDINE